MSSLHLLRTSAYSSADFLECIGLLKPSDDLILLDDGCYNINHTLLIEAQKKLFNTPYVVNLHMQARGLSNHNKLNELELSQLLELGFKHKNIITWQ